MKRYLIAAALLVMAALVSLAVTSAAAKGPKPPPPPGQLSFGQDDWYFGNVLVGSTATKDFTLSYSSTGRTGAKVTVTLGASPGPFAISANNCPKGGLKPGGSCAITVSYTPTAAGNNDTATLTASAYGVNGAVLALFGTGTGDTCTAGSEDFSGSAEGSTPTTFSGGSFQIEGTPPATGYGTSGAVVVAGSSWPVSAAFPAGTHAVFTGIDRYLVGLTFDHPVHSLTVTMGSTRTDGIQYSMTVTGYTASDTIVGSGAATIYPSTPGGNATVTSNNGNDIAYVNLFTPDSAYGFGFTNLSWTCATS